MYKYMDMLHLNIKMEYRDMSMQYLAIKMEPVFFFKLLWANSGKSGQVSAGANGLCKFLLEKLNI